MSKNEAQEWVYDQDDDSEPDAAELAAVFTALSDRSPDAHDKRDGLWSLCCSMTDNGGTRPE